MVIPAGDHKIEFRFDPASVRVGKIIAAVASTLILLALLAYVVMYYKSKNSIVEDKENKQ
jgi:phage shock protein PspC (stress-responsive transcriptional regulator)